MSLGPPATSIPSTDAAKPIKIFRHIPELDGIRGIAALMVFFHHACSAMFHPELQQGWPAWIHLLSRITLYWDSGVDLFFVLSGFLITSILITEKNSPRYYREFYYKRALRILPLYLAVLILVLPVFHQVAFTFLALAFLANFSTIFHIAGFGPYWTLAIEEQFYLLWPTVIRRLTVVQIRRWSVILGITCILLRLAFAVSGHHNYHLTFLRCDGLAFGAFLSCQFFLLRQDQEAKRRLCIWLYAAAASGAALIFLLLNSPYTRYWPALWQTSLVLLTGSFVGLSIAFTGSPILAPLRSGFLTFFGLISYALYMSHLYVISAYDRLRGTLPGGDVYGFWLRLAITAAVTVALSIVSRYLLELPAMRLRKYFLRHPNPSAESEHPPLPLARM